jgi:hypothetical protein
MIRHPRPALVLSLALAGLLVSDWTPAEAGGLFRRRGRAVTPTVQTAPVPVSGHAAVPERPLGTFTPTPYMTVRGNFPVGGGYSPNDQFGADVSMDIYGPIAATRATSAPVLTYVRGYDGRSAILQGTSFSTPNLPASTPVVYPTQATYYYGFRETQNPPWWPKAINWIDQN